MTGPQKLLACISSVVLVITGACAPLAQQLRASPDLRIDAGSLKGVRSLVIDEAALAGLHRGVLRTADREYEGTPLHAVIGLSGVWDRAGGCGVGLRDYVVVEGSGGFRALFSLTDLDPRMSEPAASGREIMLANRCNGAPLREGEGPWRLIVPDDLKRTRWVSGVTAIWLRTDR